MRHFVFIKKTVYRVQIEKHHVFEDVLISSDSHRFCIKVYAVRSEQGFRGQIINLERPANIGERFQVRHVIVVLHYAVISRIAEKGLVCESASLNVVI